MRLPASLLLLVSALPAFGQPYYVAPTGSDRNPGTLERPFASLGRAQQAARQKPGSVLLRAGTYYPGDVGFQRAGFGHAGRSGCLSGIPG